MAKFVDLDKREELVEAMVNLFSSCHFKHKTSCLPPDCKECVDRFFKYGEHLLPEEDVEQKVFAEWIIDNDCYPHCSRCNEEPTGGIMTSFCDHCGAKMIRRKQNDRSDRT